MGFELDHIFICVSPGAPQGDRLAALGLTEGSGNAHPGQGTANRRFYFRNAMLELIYVTDERDVRSDLVAPTWLWERSRWSETGASPFGVCLRATSQGATAPFETWEYRPPYLPPGVPILVAQTASAAEPMVFVNPMGVRPDAYPAEGREPVEHAAGLRVMTGVTVTVSEEAELSQPLREVERMGIARFVRGEEPLLEVEFDGGRQGQMADLRPGLPLVVRW